MSLLEVRGISKRFGGLVAVQDLNLVVQPGEILGLIGPNGAGKTTTFSLLSGFERPDTGSIRFQGADITPLSPAARCSLGLVRTFQIPRPFQALTVFENVRTAAYGRHPNPGDAAEKAWEVLELVGLAEKAGQGASGLTAGDRKRLEVARAVAAEPKLLLLDEVMAGLTPSELPEMMEVVVQLNRSGITLVVIEHLMQAIMNISHRILVLNHGRIIAEGTPTEVAANPTVIEAYLGKGFAHAYRS